MRMDGKTVVFVRGLSELGIAAAQTMLQEGAQQVIVVDQAERKSPAASALQQEYPDRLWILETDPKDIAAMENAAEQIQARFPHIHALVNGQDKRVTGGLLDIAPDDWTRAISANLTELYISCRALVPLMKAARYGRIVNLTSAAGRCADTSDIAYGAAKTGAMGFTRGLAMEVREYGMTVNSIAAGDWTEKRIRDAVIHAILYLASDEASWTTGDCMDVNDGTFVQS